MRKSLTRRRISDAEREAKIEKATFRGMDKFDTVYKIEIIQKAGSIIADGVSLYSTEGVMSIIEAPNPIIMEKLYRMMDDKFGFSKRESRMGKTVLRRLNCGFADDDYRAAQRKIIGGIKI